MKPENLEQTFGPLLEAWKAKDWGRAKPLLSHICKNMDIEIFEQTFFQTVDGARGIANLFIDTGLSESTEGSPANLFYKRTIGYIVRNEFLDSTEFTTPRSALLSETQKIKQEEGKYSFEEVAAGFGLTPEQLMTALEKIIAIENFYTQGPDSEVFVH